MPLERLVRRTLNSRQLGNNVKHGPNLRLGLGSFVNSPHGLTLGHSVAVGQRSVIEVDGTIGDFVMIGRQVQIVGKADHRMDQVGVPMLLAEWVGDRPPAAADSVHIGNDVWIGAGSIILGGVTIEDCAVIGAGSVVTHNVGAGQIVAGNPARFVRMRFEANDLQEHLSALKLRAR